MRRYEATDYAEMASWYEARGNAVPPPQFLPRVGFFEPGIAAGFLTATDTAVCWIGDFISNPSASGMARGRALVAIARRLLLEAEALGFEASILTSREPGILRQAERMAFKPLGNFAMMYRASGSDEPGTSDNSVEASA